MSNPVHPRIARRIIVALTVGAATIAAPAAADAAVGLGTADPFVVLGGSTVTNTGPSVLNGDLGVSPGTALVGFGLPAVVNGATHATNAVAAQAQLDLTTAYDVAAAQPVAPANDLTGTNFGNRTLTAGAYRSTSSAQLTGQLTLDAQGDPNAEFVFEIASALTTASASSVILINGASPCNVHWQVGSSATLGTTTAFQGNLMALTSISLNNGATVLGRMLARNGQVSLDTNVLSRPLCATGSSGPPPSNDLAGPGVTTPTGSTPGSTPTPTGGTRGLNRGNANDAQKRNGNAILRRITRNGTAITPPAGAACVEGFRAAVRGKLIAKVVFRLDGKRVATRSDSPFSVLVHAGPGAHLVRAHVTFRDATRAKNMTLRYRACAAAILQPRRGPSRFTG